MAKFKLPSGAKVSKGTQQLLQSAAFAAAARRFKELEVLESSDIAMRDYPADGPCCFKLQGFDIGMLPAKDKKGVAAGDLGLSWDLHLTIVDPTRDDDGMEFTATFPVFYPNFEDQKKRGKEASAFSYPAAQLKTILSASLDKDDEEAKKLLNDMRIGWPTILSNIIQQEYIFKGKVWTEDTDQTGKPLKFNRYYAAAFGMVEEEEPEKVEDEEVEEIEDEGVEAEEETEEETEDKDTFDVGDTLLLTNGKKVEVMSVDEDDSTFVGKSLKTKKEGTYDFSEIKEIRPDDDED